MKDNDKKRLVMDLDGTLCHPKPIGGTYADCAPRLDVIQRLREFQRAGYYIIISTSRQVRTYGGRVGLLNVETLPGVLDWLQRHDVPYDEVEVAKPWCGFEGFYVDDRAIRPSEFLRNNEDELLDLTRHETEG